MPVILRNKKKRLKMHSLNYCVGTIRKWKKLTQTPVLVAVAKGWNHLW